MEWLKSSYEKVKSAVAGPAQKVADALPLPKVATSKAPKVLGTAPEQSGTTVTGGRRHRKTRRHRGGRKTRRHRR
jgi:hypothetical protein